MSVGNNLRKYLQVGNRACAPVPLTLRQVEKVGGGTYGDVYKASFNNTGRRIAYKKITGNSNTKNGQEKGAEFEYKVAKKLKASGFDFVPEMYLYKVCYGTTGYLYMEYLDGADFNKWMKTSPSVDKVRSVLTQVAVNLMKIRSKIREFRHHDLHSGNVIVQNVPRADITWTVDGKTYKRSNEGVSVTFIDFGMSTMPGIPNPWINNGGFRNYGINKKRSHYMFDIHLFMNKAVYTQIKYSNKNTKKYREVMRFIEDVFPKSYLVKNSDNVSGHGIKLGRTHDKLPKFKNILSHSFLTGVPNMNAVKAFNKNMTSKLPKIGTKMLTKNNATKALGVKLKTSSARVQRMYNSMNVGKKASTKQKARTGKPPLPPRGKTKPKANNTKPKSTNTRYQRMLASMARP
jgi:serine/threonine protein kinase